MFCGACGSETYDNARFCHVCGEGMSFRMKSRRQEAKSGGFRLTSVLATILLLAGLACCAFFVKRGPLPNYALNLYDRLTKKAHSVPLAASSLTINQLGYSYFKLEVPAKASSVSLRGNFTAYGTAGSTIEAYLFSQDGYHNWQSNAQADPFYTSGKVTMGTIDAALPSGAGAYYLVFNNKFSTSIPKTIRLNAKLTYYK